MSKTSVKVKASSEFNKVNALILIEKDNYYYVANIPKLLRGIDDEASKKLISYIMQRFLDSKLLKGLKFFSLDTISSNIEPIALSIEYYKSLFKKYIFLDQKLEWESIVTEVNKSPLSEPYRLYINPRNLMIHVKDIIKIFKDLGLKQEAKDLKNKVLKPAQNKILIQETDQQIIKLYNEIKKQNPGYSDEKCAKEIEKNVIKGKNEKTIKKAIAEKIEKYELKTITDKISDYFSKLIKNLYNEYKIRCNNFLIPEIKSGIAYKELENNQKILKDLRKELVSKKKEKNDKSKKNRIKEQIRDLMLEIENADKEHYNTYQEKIDCSYKEHGTKPTDAQIIAMLDQEFITFTAKNLGRPKDSICRIIFNQKK